MPTFNELKAEYGRLWRTMSPTPTRAASVTNAARKLLAGVARYKAVAANTGVPAIFLMASHWRESNGKWDTYLGNGQKLSKVTTIVPTGRGPFPTWEAGANDALRLHNLDAVRGWTIERVAFELERWNGWGYHNRNLPSPYLWAGTQHSRKGKYVADGKFDPEAVDQQLGCMPLIRRLIELDPSLAVSGAVEPRPDDPGPSPAPKAETPPAAKPVGNVAVPAAGVGGALAALALLAGASWITLAAVVGGGLVIAGGFIAYRKFWKKG